MGVQVPHPAPFFGSQIKILDSVTQSCNTICMQSNLYLAIHAFLTIILAIRVIRLRWKYKVSFHHGEQKELLIATRVFGNHNEYAPLFLILLFVLDFQSASAVLINGLGIVFTIGRLSHAIGLTYFPGRSAGRVFGMILTFGCLTIEAIALLISRGFTI